MTLTSPHTRILQIHPTRRCNLQCLHCYSSSSPQERDELDVELLSQAITDASSEGYLTVSFSGGEPLVYKPLLQLLKHSHQHHLNTAVVSNGMLLDERQLERLKGALDLLVISLDGIPSSHNRMRNSERAFEIMASRLEGIRQSGIPFGFLFTLTQETFRELDWVANFALKQGAKLLQIHPLEAVGRAKQNLAEFTPTETLFAYAYLRAMRLQEAMGDRLYIQVDLAHQEFILANPSRVFADADKALENMTQFRFAEILSPLIIEADGTVVPIQYGLARQYALGNLKNASLGELMNTWRQEGYPIFLELCQRVYEEVTAPAKWPIFDWYAALSRQAALTS